MAQKRANRRLAAILSADVIGYSSMMGANEYGTLKAVKHLRTATMDRLLKRFEGRLIKTTGDGFLFEFGSVFDAFDFAAAIQGRTPQTDALRLRMGLNVGDIIFDDGDVFGDGVNIAARLEPLSPPGGLMVSNRAWEDLRRLPLTFEDAGQIDLKNIKDPLRAWHLQNEQLREYWDALDVDADELPSGIEELSSRADIQPLRSRRAVLAGGAVATAALAGVGGWVLLRNDPADASNSIAVLPFNDLGGDPAQAQFADGVAGEIRNTLTRIAGLKVAGSTSSDAVRSDDAQSAARKLGVGNILTGNVRQTASTIRVNVELIDGRTGLAKWSQNYDRVPGDVIKIQSDVAQNVARALAIALSAGARRALAVGETSNIAAQTLAFQARNLSYQLTVAALQQSVRLVDQAIALDGNYARAYALKSFFINNLVLLLARTPAERANGRKQALGYAKTALSIAPNLPIARSALGFGYLNSVQLRESFREQKIAFTLASGDPDVIRNYGYALSYSGKPKEALKYVDEALALDPLNSGSHRGHVNVLFDARRYDEVVRYCLKLKQESPELFRFPEVLGESLLMLGRFKEAGLAFADAGSLVGDALLTAKSGNRELALIKLAELRQRDGDMASYNYARIYAQVGDTNRAFDALDRAWEVRDSGLSDLKTEPFLDPIRNDPRYATLVEKIGFPD
ncbi:MAG: adenylate/guanylate cyclase domain-containing protein [Sphingomicrobium sp.]